MTAEDLDLSRRRFLSAATSVVGGVGLACASIPFIASWLPSSKTQAMNAPIEVDISKIEPGQKITVAWRGQPIFILHRTPQELSSLPSLNEALRDPFSKESIQPIYAQNEFRSIKKDIFVAIGICTHLGCVPLFRPELNSVESGWQGGFFCPCHGSKYDLAGRVYKNVPAPTNLVIPPYQFLSDSILRVGEDIKEGTS